MRKIKIASKVMGLACVVLLGSCHGAAKSGSNVVNWPDEGVLMVNNGSAFKPDYVAIYPATNVEGVANSIDGYEATFYLPASQPFYMNTFTKSSMPKVAYSIGEELQFKYVLGGLCMLLEGKDVRVTKAVLTSANADEALWGTCTSIVSTTGEDPTSTITNDEVGKNKLTLDCGEGVMLNDTLAIGFCFAVPVGSLEDGFTVEVFDGDNKIFEKSTTQAPGSGFITRNNLRRMKGSFEIVNSSESADATPHE